MNEWNLQHPDISRIERTGYGYSEDDAPAGLECSVCGQGIMSCEAYGECDGKVICSDCINEEWEELTDEEKFESMGYNVRRVI